MCPIHADYIMLFFRHYGELGWEEVGGGGQQETRRGREEEGQDANCTYAVLMNGKKITQENKGKNVT